MTEDSHKLRLKDSRAYKENPEKHFSGVSSLTEPLCSALSQAYLPGSHSLTWKEPPLHFLYSPSVASLVPT